MGNRSIRKWLLVACLLFLAVETAAAQNIWRTLMVKPEQEYCFAGETCIFTLVVPGYAPSRIDTTLQSTPDNVALISTTKEEIIDNGKRSTKITFYFRFSKAGTYQIRNLAARIDWTWSYIPFQRITVYDNPITLAPELFLNYPTTIYASEPFEMDVSAHFFSEFTDLAAQLDENFIVRLKEYTYPLPIKTGGFSTDQYPIATYEIIPLTEGKLALPPITALMRSYAGVQQTVVSSSPTVTVLPKRTAHTATTPAETASSSIEDTMEQKFLDSAYEDFPIIEINMQQSTESVTVTAEEQWISLKNRRATLNLLLLISAVVAGLGVLLLPAGIILNSRKKIKALLIVSIVSTAVGFATQFPTLWFAHPRYAVCYETNVHTIPEDDSNTILLVPEGTIVRIIKESSDWFCIETEHAGLVWIKKNECLVE
ncbi:MAG: hypothetical protein MJ178_09170 [Treponemataceae bacterium]|nr:hypothetical protein [Treponemataceae bacterium]